MPKGRALAGVVLAAALIGACDGAGDLDTGSSSATDTSGGERAEGAASRQDANPTDRRDRAGGLNAEPCEGAIRLHDPPRDTRSWRQPEPAGRPPTPRSADLRRFELLVDRARLCVRWTLAARAPRKTTLAFFARGPLRARPGGGGVFDQYGFEVVLLAEGARVSYATEPTRPRLRHARIRRSGATVSAVVLHSELGLTAPDMPERPPFPRRAFFFETRVITPPDRRGGQDVDHWPEGRSGQAAYIRGRLCAPPCNDRRLWAGMTRERSLRR